MESSLIYDFLLGIGFEKSNVDHCLYKKKDNNHVVYKLVWVDDLIITTNCIYDLIETNNLLSIRFKMTDM